PRVASMGARTEGRAATRAARGDGPRRPASPRPEPGHPGRSGTIMQHPEPSRSGDATPADESPAEAAMIRQFVEHWGMMARSWGINPTMGELFALLYITGDDWTADGLRHRLKVSRGNVSMNLRELIAWGVVHKVHRQGERREFFRA